VRQRQGDSGVGSGAKQVPVQLGDEELSRMPHGSFHFFLFLPSCLVHIILFISLTT
jgi:hypothetical protein